VCNIRAGIQNFLNGPHGPRTANGTILCYWVQLYRYFVSQSSDFRCHNHLCCSQQVFIVVVVVYFVIDSVRKLLDTPSYYSNISLSAK
jgi:hypothetical protein